MAGKTGWRKLPLELAKAGELLRDYAAPCKGDPLEAFVFRDNRGRHRRLTARYAEGWSLRVNFALNGAVSSYMLSCSFGGVIASSDEEALA